MNKHSPYETPLKTSQDQYYAFMNAAMRDGEISKREQRTIDRLQRRIVTAIERNDRRAQKRDAARIKTEAFIRRKQDENYDTYSPENYLGAGKILDLRDAYTQRIKNGDTSDKTAAIHEYLSYQAAAAEDTLARYAAGALGLRRGISIGTDDNIAGLVSLLNGQGYASGRNKVLADHRLAKEAYAKQYARGEFLGDVGSFFIPAGVVANGAKAVSYLPKIGPKAVALARRFPALSTATRGVAKGSVDGVLTGQKYYENAGEPAGQRSKYIQRGLAEKIPPALAWEFTYSKLKNAFGSPPKSARQSVPKPQKHSGPF